MNKNFRRADTVCVCTRDRRLMNKLRRINNPAHFSIKKKRKNTPVKSVRPISQSMARMCNKEVGTRSYVCVFGNTISSSFRYVTK